MQQKSFLAAVTETKSVRLVYRTGAARCAAPEDLSNRLFAEDFCVWWLQECDLTRAGVATIIDCTSLLRRANKPARL